MKLNGSKYCYVSLKSIKHQSFVYKHLNDQTVLFQTIQFSISHLFALSLNDLVWFYGISTIIGYLMPNSSLYI